MTEDVKWANGMEGGFVYGRDAVREYWTRQFTIANPQVTPQKIVGDADKTIVKVHQIVKDMDGNLLLDVMIDHIFHLENGLVKTFEIGESWKGCFVGGKYLVEAVTISMNGEPVRGNFEDHTILLETR